MERVAVVPLWKTATACADQDTIISYTIDMRRNKGLAAMLVVLAGTGTNEVDITREASIVDSKQALYYTPYDDSGNNKGTVLSALTATRYFSFSPRTAKYMRYKITGTSNNGSNTTVQAWLIFREDV